MGQCSSCSEELLQSPPGLGPAAIRERDELVPHHRGSPSAEIVGSHVSERGPCWERQLSPAKVPSRRRRPARHPSLSCRARRVRAAASPARPVPTAGSGSKWRWLRPRCCPGRRLPRRYRPRRRLPWCRGPGNRRYSPSASSRRRRTPSPNGGRRGHPPRGSKGAGGCPSPMVPRARDDVTDVTLSRRTPARGGGRGSPVTGGQLGTPVKAGVGTMRCQSQPAPPHQGGRRTSRGEDKPTAEVHPYLLRSARGHVLLHPALEAGGGAARGVRHHLRPAGTAAGPAPRPCHGSAAVPQRRSGGVETAACRGGERGCPYGAVVGQHPGARAGAVGRPPSAFPTSTHTARLPLPRRTRPPFYPPWVSGFFLEETLSAHQRVGSRVYNPPCRALPVSTWSCGEQPAPSAVGELALIRHSALGHVQHLAMA